MRVYRHILDMMIDGPDKSWKGKPKHVLYSIFLFCENSFIYERVKKYGAACGAIRNTDTHAEYEILTASPQQQWLHERPSMPRAALLRQIVTRSFVL
jgi:hypothetical protein